MTSTETFGRQAHTLLAEGAEESGKSSFLSLEILLGLIAEQGPNQWCCERWRPNFADSAFRADELGPFMHWWWRRNGRKKSTRWSCSERGKTGGGGAGKSSFWDAMTQKVENPSNFREVRENSSV